MLHQAIERIYCKHIPNLPSHSVQIFLSMSQSRSQVGRSIANGKQAIKIIIQCLASYPRYPPRQTNNRDPSSLRTHSHTKGAFSIQRLFIDAPFSCDDPIGVCQRGIKTGQIQETLDPIYQLRPQKSI